MRDYVTEVAKCIQNMVYIDIDSYLMRRIDRFARKAALAKHQEYGHRTDSCHEYKRFFTGMMGECAVEKYFGVKFADWSVGDSYVYNHADMSALGLNVGIKTSELYKFPVVHKKAYRPEFICIRRAYSTVIICGLATPDVLNTFQDDSLILSPYLRQKGTKTGFYGFDRLIPVCSLSEISGYRFRYERGRTIGFTYR